MVKKRVFVLIILELVGVFGFYISERNNNSDIYQVNEDAQRNILTISNPKSDKPTLREIIYYHIIEKPYEDLDDNGKPFNKNMDKALKLAENNHYKAENNTLENKYNEAENEYVLENNVDDNITAEIDLIENYHNNNDDEIDGKNDLGNNQTEEYKTTDNVTESRYNNNEDEIDIANEIKNRTTKEYITTDTKSFYDRVLKRFRSPNFTADGNLESNVKNDLKEFDFEENNRHFTNGQGFQFLSDPQNETPIVNLTDIETNTNEDIIPKNTSSKIAEVNNKNAEMDQNPIEIDKTNSSTLVNEPLVDKEKEDQVVTEETSTRRKRSSNIEGKTYGMSLTGGSGVIWNEFNNRKISFAVGTTTNKIKDRESNYEKNAALRTAVTSDDGEEDKQLNKNKEEGIKPEELPSKEDKFDEQNLREENKSQVATSKEENKSEEITPKEENKFEEVTPKEENKFEEGPSKELKFEETSAEIVTTEAPSTEMNEPIDMQPSYELKSGNTYGISLTGDRDLVWNDLNGLRVAYHVGDSNEQNEVSGIEEKSIVKKRNEDDEIIDAKIDKFEKEIKKSGTTKPSTQKPTTRKPTSQKPRTKKPRTQKPRIQTPTTKKLTTQKPTTQKPTTQKPTTKKPTTEKPRTQPTSQKPTNEKPKTYGMSLNGDHGLVWNDLNGQRISYHVGETQSEEPALEDTILTIDNSNSDKPLNNTQKPSISDNKNDTKPNISDENDKPNTLDEKNDKATLDEKNDKPNTLDENNDKATLDEKNDKPNTLDEKNDKATLDEKNDKPNTLDDKNDKQNIPGDLNDNPITTDETNKYGNITDFQEIVDKIKEIFANETANLKDKLNCANSENQGEDKLQNNATLANEIAGIIKDVLANETAKLEDKLSSCIHSKDKINDGENEKGYNKTSNQIEDILKIVKNEEFWIWLNEWTTTYTELLMNRIDKRIKEEVSKQIQEYFAANNTVTEIPDIDIRFGDKEDNTTQNDFTDPQTKKRNDRDENKKEKKPPIEIQATNIYGNSVGNNNVTNIFIFNINNISDVENIKELSNGTNGVYIFGDDGKPIKNDTVLIGNKNDTAEHTTQNPNETTQISSTTPIEDNTVDQTTENPKEVTTEKENVDEKTTETPKDVTTEISNDITTEKVSDTTTEIPKDVTIEKDSIDKTTEKENTSDTTTQSPKDLKTTTETPKDRTTTTAESLKDGTTETENNSDTTTQSPKDLTTTTETPKDRTTITAETLEDETTETENNSDTTTQSPKDLTTTTETPIDETTIDETPEDVTTETENNSDTTIQTPEDLITTTETSTDETTDEAPEDVTTETENNTDTTTQSSEDETTTEAESSEDVTTEMENDSTTTA